MLPQIFEPLANLSFDLIENSSGNANTARVSQALDTSSNVYTVTIDTIILVKNIAQIDSNTENHTTIIGEFAVFDIQGVLNIDGSVDGIQGTAELSQNVVARCIDYPSLVFWINSEMILR
jgi:hypothetical protein